MRYLISELTHKGKALEADISTTYTFFFLSFIKLNTPTILNIGRYAATEAHFAFESGVKFGLAGKSGGKKKDSIICIYLCSQPYNKALQPLGEFDIRGFSVIVASVGKKINALAAKPSTASKII